MQDLTKALLVAGVFGISLTAQSARADGLNLPFTGKVAVYSEYEYRGISQTSEKPAGQLNLDYAHSSGLYIGTFLSNIKWLKDTAEANGFSSDANLEWDIYGGYKFAVTKDVTLDVGYQRYEYPSSGAFTPKPNTDEVYIGGSWGPATLKYWYSFNDTFGVANSKGSDYIELAVNYPLPSLEKLTINGVLGHQRYKHSDFLDYTVWKLGATYDFGHGFNAGAYWKGTDAESGPYTVKGKDWSRDRVVAFVSYSF